MIVLSSVVVDPLMPNNSAKRTLIEETASKVVNNYRQLLDIRLCFYIEHMHWWETRIVMMSLPRLMDSIHCMVKDIEYACWSEGLQVRLAQ